MTRKNDNGERSNRLYPRYVLVVLIIVYVFNFIDRQILSILAEDIKAHMGIGDAAIGFLYGTAFAVFYAVFGIPLGRLADIWVRKSVISAGLAFWSLMTALSGTSQGFTSLAAYRIGVGIGESSATPAAFSMLSDYFSPRRRATVLAFYSTGIYIGAGIGIFLGGWIVDSWKDLYPDPAAAPFGLHGWQAAFLAVGLPGLLMSLWVRTLREPQRGLNEGLQTAKVQSPFREFGRELMVVLPLLGLLELARSGGGKAVAYNLGMAVMLALCAWLLIAWTGSLVQWVALAIGLYASLSWVQKLAMRDPPAFALICSSPALRFACLGFACIAFISYGLGFWGAPFFIRYFGASETEVGIYLGLSAAVGGLLGVGGGGLLGDYLKRKTPAGRLYVGLLAIILSTPCALTLLNTDNLVLAYVANFLFNVFSPMWIGSASSTVNDLVLPRMRAVASAIYILTITFIGLALGPYAIGWTSDILGQTMATAQALRLAMEFSLAILVLAFICILLAIRHLPKEESGMLQRARALGEPV